MMVSMTRFGSSMRGVTQWKENLLGHKALFSSQEQEQRSLVQKQRLALQCVMRMQKDWSKLEQAQAVCRWVEGCELHRMEEAFQVQVNEVAQALAAGYSDAERALQQERSLAISDLQSSHHSDVEALGEQLVAQLESAEAASEAKQKVAINAVETAAAKREAELSTRQRLAMAVETDAAKRFCCHMLWAMMRAHASSLWVSCTSRAVMQWRAQKELCEMEERLVAAQARSMGATTASRRAGDLRWCLSVRSMMLRTLLKSHLMQVVWCVHLACDWRIGCIVWMHVGTVADVVVWMAVEAWAGVLSTASCSCSGGVDASVAAATKQVDGMIVSMEMGVWLSMWVFVLQVG